MSLIENARIVSFKNDGDFISIRWLTESKKQIVSRYTDDNKDDFVASLQARGITTKEKILATTFSISIYESRGELKVRPDMVTADELKTISVPTTKKVVPAKTAETNSVVAAKTTTSSFGPNSFADKTRASKMGKIGANKLHNKLALKRAQDPIMKLRERIESLKFDCSPAFVETCNQFNSMLSAELRNLEK